MTRTTIPHVRRLLAVAVATGLVSAGALTVAAPAGAAPLRSASSASADRHDERHETGRAVFVLTDDPTGNGVIAFSRSSDGSLTRKATYATGGLGARLTGAVVDPLASQGALAYDDDHGLLYAVNAGSNTITVFAVDGSQLRRIQVLDSRGSIPVSVSVEGDLVYVLNAGGTASIAGFRVDDGRLHAIAGSVRSLGLPDATSPGFLASPGQIGITPDGRHVVATTKLNHTVLTWNLDRSGRPSAAPTTATVGGVPFAFSFDRHGRLLLVNAAGTLSSWDVATDGTLVAVAPPVNEQGKAACWIATSGRFAYVANAGSGTISGFRVGRDGSLTLLDPTDGVTATTGPGPIDMAVAGRTLYVENGGNGSLSTFHIEDDGSLTPLDVVTGLTSDGSTGVEGIVAI